MNLTDEELLAYSGEHLFYEIAMLVDVSRLDLRIIPDELKVVVNNLMVESFAIHLRSLIDFLYKPSHTRNTDVYAENFFSNQNEWATIRPTISDSLKDARKRADKEVKHITVERISGSTNPQKAWRIGRLADEIISLLKIFTNTANKDKLDKKISNYLHQSTMSSQS